MNHTLGKNLISQILFVCYFCNMEHFDMLKLFVNAQISYNLILMYLMFQIRQNDRLAVSKLVTSLTRGSVRSPLAQCLLIRYTSQVRVSYLPDLM
jgi:hypothetical protein